MFTVATVRARAIATDDVCGVECNLYMIGVGTRSLTTSFEGHALPTCIKDGFSLVVGQSTLEASRTDKLVNAFFGYSWNGVHGCVSMYLFCMVMDITAVYYHICMCVTRFRPAVLPMCPSCYNLIG